MPFKEGQPFKFNISDGDKDECSRATPISKPGQSLTLNKWPQLHCLHYRLKQSYQ